jgi:hypothetical protein
MAENVDALLRIADTIEAIGEFIPSAPVRIGTLLAAEVLRMFIDLVGSGSSPDDAAQRLRRALRDDQAIAAVMVERELALKAAMNRD